MAKISNSPGMYTYSSTLVYTSIQNFPSSEPCFVALWDLLPMVKIPKNANTPKQIATTARVRPAPRKPAPTGEILLWCTVASAACDASASAPQPLSIEFEQTEHHSAVVLTPVGYMMRRRKSSVHDPHRECHKPCMVRERRKHTARLSTKVERGMSPSVPNIL